MTAWYSKEALLLTQLPVQVPNAARTMGRVKRIGNLIDLANMTGPGLGGNAHNGDTVQLMPLPLGSVFCFGKINCPTLGNTTLAISDGTNTYLAAATFQTGITADFGANGPEAISVSAETQVWTPTLTFGAADPPAAGIISVDFYVSQAS